MDIGGFRDMHRHRRATQIKQGFTARHGYETPESGDAAGLAEAGVVEEYRRTVEGAQRASARIAAGAAPEAAVSALYVLPLATRVRCMFKMDFAEAQYISRAAVRAGGALQLSKSSVGDVPGAGAAASIAGEVCAGYGFQPAD